MTRLEIKHTAILATIFALRMLGLFMVLPVLPLCARELSSSTPALIGVALGIYGFSQALLQLPFGILSDYMGRKPVIISGLILFSLGSLIAAFSHSIGGLILGRAVQGAGAVGSVVLAQLSDITRAEVRSRAMAIVGMSIGATFVIAIAIGPVLNNYLGFRGIFAMTAVLAILAIGLLLTVKQEGTIIKPLAFEKQVRQLLKQSALWYLNLAIFVLHAFLTMAFLILPYKIQQVSTLAAGDEWQFYLPVLLISLLLVMPLLRYADESSWQLKLMKIAMLVLGVGLLLLLLASWFPLFILAATLFFIGFNYLEASLPAFVSRVALPESKGSALGVYSCAQFLGIFVGGVMGGYLQQWIGLFGIGLGCLLLMLIGWVALSFLKLKIVLN